ncbi:2-dehydropantoate 2-reductase [bacterium]|nr:2-dehydropantoate 2-reductase [bacterium]
MMQICIFGAGAIGALYGGKLAQSGACVDVVCRSNVEYIRQSGFHIQSLWGNFHFVPNRVLENASEAGGQAYDIVIVATKVLDSDQTALEIAPLVGPNTVIVLLQNGIEIEFPYLNRYPGNPIISGLAFVCVNKIGVSNILHLDYGRLVIGLYPVGVHASVGELAAYWASAGVPVKVSETIRKERWRKLIWNAPFNPLSAILKQTTDSILAVPELEMLSRTIMAEVVQLAAADGYVIDPSAIDQNIRDTKQMTPYKTSMMLDVENKRPIERGAILENAIGLAEKHNVPVPAMRSLNAILKGLYG